MHFTPCDCAGPGWCTRHRCAKPDVLYQLCRRNQLWFEAWEAGTAPCYDGVVEHLEAVSAGPSLVQRTVNFSRAAIRHAADGFSQVDETTYAARLDICRACSSCDVARLVCRELSCGCYLQTKARWASESCPLGKWPAAQDAPNSTPVAHFPLETEV